MVAEILFSILRGSSCDFFLSSSEVLWIFPVVSLDLFDDVRTPEGKERERKKTMYVGRSGCVFIKCIVRLFVGCIEDLSFAELGQHNTWFVFLL